jgi:hypothetical protein
MSPTESQSANSTSVGSSSKYFPIRRSTRLALEIPLRVTSLDPKVKFAENCNTVTVSAHGCGIISPKPLEIGVRANLEIVADKQSTSARVLELVPLSEDNSSWLLGMEMERPGNFWGIKYAPADWAEEEAPAAAASAGPAAPAATAPAQVTQPAPTKEIPASAMRRLLSECRLAAISVGATYVQTVTTFPVHAPVKITIRPNNAEFVFRGTIRVEHVGSGMGIEFTGRNEEHSHQIAALINALSAGGGKLPEVRVELGTPDKSAGKSTSAPAPQTAGDDSLLGLILAGGSMKRAKFLQELENQRRRT